MKTKLIKSPEVFSVDGWDIKLSVSKANRQETILAIANNERTMEYHMRFFKTELECRSWLESIIGKE